MPSILDHLLLLPTALLALSVQCALAGPLEGRDTNNTVIAAPIAFAPDESWDGIDGSWSSFTVRIGTPAQYIRTFVSFASWQTLAVLPQGCQGASDYNSCAGTRGYIFNESASTTFQNIGLYAWGIEESLGLPGNALYGYDTVGLGGAGETGPTLANTTVGGFAVDDFYLGIFGINPKPTNFTSFDGPSPSFMTQLKEQKYISSVSASYTAGAPYRFSGVLASLTLGGYDSSKFVENNVEFEFAADNSRDIVVGVQSINTPSVNSSNPVATELLPGAIYMYVDSTVPQIWLPLEACKVFEYEFGLVYDNTTELYLVNDTLHKSLLQKNASITFSLAQSTSGGNTVEITLPYTSFDLTASPPYQGLTNQTRYFPLRRAANETQYTIGRTFLQEAYLTVDWEAQRFNVSQVVWNQGAQTSLVAIPPFTGQSTTSSTNQSSSRGLSGGAIGGIVAGIVAILALLALLLFWYLHRKHRAAKAKAAQEEKLGEVERNSDLSAADANARGREQNVFIKAELEGSMPVAAADAESEHRRLLSSNGSGAPATPGTIGAPSSLNYFPNRGSSAYSPSTPTPGEGTQSSSHSDSNGTYQTHSTMLSPLSPSNASEADSKERQIYEMAGDMPTIKEKDGKALSEKEAMARRERIYNGVDSPPRSAVALDEPAAEQPRERRTVNPEEVVMTDRLAPPENDSLVRHRAFSFEELRTQGAKTEGTSTNASSDDLYSAK
ncbi:hypothetical protein LTR12_015041 [Friedmanniomyces endolithicus]|nr:hypothetical protein LTR12_015041 [Friedmanniomyces endolithicus]